MRKIFGRHSGTGRCAAALRRVAALGRDCGGAIAVITALALPLIVGLAALGSEVGTWYVARRTMQGAADSAALTAATDVMGGDTSGYTAAAQSVTASYQFTNGSNGTVVTVNKPPASGPYKTDSSAVEVIITQSRTPLLARRLLPSLTLTARAVATAGNASGACVLALDPSLGGAITINGNATINMSCGIASNSSSSSSMLLNGNVSVTATAASVVGNFLINGNSKLNTPDTQVGASPMADPYGSSSVPSYQGCDHQNYTSPSSGTFHIEPGVYCGGIIINGNTNVVMDPGVYTMDGGSFIVNGNTTLSGNGVTVVLTSSTKSNYGTVVINGNSTVNLTPPTSGPTAGYTFYSDRAITQDANFNGNSNSSIGGVLYFPSQHVNFNGNSKANDSCLELVAKSITFNGNSTFSDTGCSAIGAKSIGTTPVVLVE